jgi:hypothetical protein
MRWAVHLGTSTDLPWHGTRQTKWPVSLVYIQWIYCTQYMWYILPYIHYRYHQSCTRYIQWRYATHMAQYTFRIFRVYSLYIQVRIQAISPSVTVTLWLPAWCAAPLDMLPLGHSNPDFFPKESTACRCGFPMETVSHVLHWCPSHKQELEPKERSLHSPT